MTDIDAVLKIIKSFHPKKWDGEICDRCHRRNTVGYNLPDDLWAKITEGKWNILCLTCLDEAAEEKQIEYLPPKQFYAVSWNM